MQAQIAQEIAPIYTLIANLFRQPPNTQQLEFLAQLTLSAEDNVEDSVEDTNPYSAPWHKLKHAAQTYTKADVADEYQNLFIGIGRGEVVPYASWHLTGSLMEKPLVELRQMLQALGFERQDGVKEPEDGIASILEVMSFLIEDNHPQQSVFFNRYLASWVGDLCAAISQAPSAKFYLALAQVLYALCEQEAARLQIRMPLKQI
ncbi:MAG: TorD/DmsD family molecular chaperone [Vibrio sp.]